MQLDGSPVPRLPDSVPGLPVAESSRPSYHEALRVAHEVHANTMARGRHRHGGTGTAVVSGVLLMALLVGGFLAVNRYVWTDQDEDEASQFEVQTALFGAKLPVLPVEQSRSEVTLGVTARVSTWTAQAGTLTITIVEFDMDMVAPGAAQDPARVDGMRQSGHDAVVQREGMGTVASSATSVDGRQALTSSATKDGRAITVTSVLHRSSLVAVVCQSATAVMPPECAAALDSIDLH